MRLTGKVAIVTGASRGIGARIAEVLAGEGARVAVTARPAGSGAGESLQATARRISDAGGEALAVGCDVGDEEDVRSMVARTLDRYGHIDLLINNAAMRLATRLLDTTTAEMERIFRVNVLGPFLLWKHVLPSMIGRGRGNVINIVSTNATRQPFIGMAPYRMTKVALTFLSTDIASEVKHLGIAVNALDPGPVATEGTAWIRREREEIYGTKLAYHEQDSVEVIDAPIVWLALQTAETFTGHVVGRSDFGTSWGLNTWKSSDVG